MFVFIRNSAGQASLQDSIRGELEQLNNDSSRFDWILKRSRITSQVVAKSYLETGITLAKDLGENNMLAKLYMEEAILYNMQGLHLKGVESFEKVDSLAQMIKDTSKMAAVQVNMGLSYYYMGFLDLALEHYLRAYHLYKIVDLPVGLSRLLNNLAIALKQNGRQEEAVQYYQESYRIKESLNDSSGMASTLMNLAILQSHIDKYEEGMSNFERSQGMFLALYDTTSAFECQLAKGKAMLDHGQWHQAWHILLESYSHFKTNDPRSQSTMMASADLAEICINQEQWSLAGDYLSEALALAKSSDRLEMIRELLLKKAQVENALGKSEQAYLVLSQSYQLNDSLNAQKRLSLMEEMQTKFKVEEKEQEIAGLNMQNQLHHLQLKTAKNRNLLLVLFALGISVFAFVLYRINRQIKAQKSIVVKTLADKETLLKEIHHRVKNNLQVISSLLSMQSYQIKDQEALEAVQESRNRVKSMALIHQNLYQEKDLVSINAAEYISDLTESLFMAYNIEHDRIRLETAIEPLLLDVDIMIPLGLILNELISNALKYAFSDGRNGELLVKLSQQNEEINLLVADDGIGLPENFNLEETSMGYTLVQDFCRKLKAILNIASENGTKITLSIPTIQTIR